MSDEDRKKYKDCRRFTQVSVYEGTVEFPTQTTNPGLRDWFRCLPGHKDDGGVRICAI